MQVDVDGRLEDMSVLNVEGSYGPEASRILRDDGAKIFKKKTLGHFRRQITHNIDEMVKILYDIGFTKSIEDSKEILPYLKKETIDYGLFGEIKFDALKNSNGDDTYRIKAYFRLPL